MSSPFTSKIPGSQDRRPKTLTIPDVPAYVTREQILNLIRALGINPDEVAAMSFAYDAVNVEVYSNHKPGSVPIWRWTPDGKEAATHRLTIPILDKEPTP